LNKGALGKKGDSGAYSSAATGAISAKYV